MVVKCRNGVKIKFEETPYYYMYMVALNELIGLVMNLSLMLP